MPYRIYVFVAEIAPAQSRTGSLSEDTGLDYWYLLAFLVTGAVSGLLAGLLGIGGGAIIVPSLMLLFAGMHAGDEWIPHQAVATSLATVIATGAAAAWAHHRRGAVRWDLLMSLVPGLLFGAWLGAFVGGWLPDLWLKRLFGLFLLFSSFKLLSQPSPKPAQAPPSALGLAGPATVFGALSALLGIGGGILIVPYLARQGIALRHAVGTSSACGVPMAMAGTLGFVLTGWGRAGLPAHSIGFVYWPAALAIIAASMPMATIGARLAHRLPTPMLKRVFALLLLLVGLRLLTS